MIFDQFWNLLEFGKLLATALDMNLDFFMNISMILSVDFHGAAGAIDFCVQMNFFEEHLTIWLKTIKKWLFSIFGAKF